MPLQRLEKGLRLVQGLVVLLHRVGVRDDATAAEHEQLVGRRHRRPDEDVRVHAAVVVAVLGAGEGIVVVTVAVALGEAVDVVVDLTETGRALKAAGLQIIDEILTSYTLLIANPAAAADPAKRKAMAQIQTLLLGVLDARGKVLVKMNVPTESLNTVVNQLPSAKSPTVNEL